MIVSYKAFNLPFVYPFTISKGTKTHQPALIIKLQHFALTGYGEAPAITYYNIPVQKMIDDLEAKKHFIEKFSFSDPERFWHFLHHLFPQKPFLVCALDMAGWDIYGQLKRKPLHKLWYPNSNFQPQTDYTIGIDTTENMVAKMTANPWPVYKIKVGFDGDVDAVAALRKYTSAPFRVDANAGWTVDEAITKIELLKDLGVELVEQPLPKDDWAGMARLYNLSALPLFADEACVSEHDVEKCVNHFNGINIKLTKCGGITPARRMIEKAKELNLKVMLGCMNESTIGSAALVHLAPGVNFLDADGPLLLAEDTATGLTYDAGTVTPSDNTGLGIQVKAW